MLVRFTTLIEKDAIVKEIYMIFWKGKARGSLWGTNIQQMVSLHQVNANWAH